eukprot:9502057-Pyramimonas_sp.AAC.1
MTWSKLDIPGPVLLARRIVLPPPEVESACGGFASSRPRHWFMVPRGSLNLECFRNDGSSNVGRLWATGSVQPGTRALGSPAVDATQTYRKPAGPGPRASNPHGR